MNLTDTTSALSLSHIVKAQIKRSIRNIVIHSSPLKGKGYQLLRLLSRRVIRTMNMNE